MPDGMPNGRQHLYRRSIPLARPAIRHLNIQNIGTATVLMQHDCIRTVRRGSGGIMPLYMIRTHFQWIGRRMTLRPSRDARPFNDRDESVFYFRFQYLKNKINCFTSAFRISVKKVVHCNVIFYKYHVEDV